MKLRVTLGFPSRRLFCSVRLLPALVPRVRLAYRAGMRFSPALRVRRTALLFGPVALGILLTSAQPAAGQTAEDLEAARELLARGAYEDAAQRATPVVNGEKATEDWPLLLGEALMATGKIREARAAMEPALGTFPNSLRLRLLAHEVMRQNGDTGRAKALLAEMDQLGGLREWAYRSPADRVALARVALLAGADPKRVLERFLDPLKKEKPDFRDSYLASGEIALAKSDFALAGKVFGAAARKFPADAEVWFGLARALADSDAEAAGEALKKTLAANPHHTGAHLMIADHQLDAEHLDEAEAAVLAALQTNPALPEAHALLAIIAELRGDAKGVTAERAEALKFWTANPAVDHLIGKNFSQKYRFAEGAEHQRQALQFDPDFLPAKIQLAQDLLRLGQTDEGWKLAEEVQKADPYDVVAFNLVTLKDSMAHFRTLTSEHFLVRMEPKEAEVYGDRVVALLERAHAHLSQKYGLEPDGRTTVEIFPDQKDFAIRTFGLPGGVGYLGVCFGHVITANSPAARPGAASNWESMLWHEFTHVVTLQLTRNRMPRWLSEGISVFEERQARGNWGEQMSPRYRAMMLGEDLTPLSQLSGAFMNPKTPAHIGFAYYESSLAVEFLLERFGLPAMKHVFEDLAAGVPINAALAKHAAPLDHLDREFAERARQLARAVGPRLDWSKPKGAEVASAAAYEQWIEANPENYSALLERARKDVEARDWKAAKAPLQKLIELYPDQHAADSAYASLARAHRELGEIDAERAVLEKLTALSADATDALERLMELAVARSDWPAVLALAEEYAAVHPLTSLPHRFAAQAHEAQHHAAPALASYQTVLRLDPADPSDVHFRIAQLSKETGDVAAAKRHVLLALEEAPRFREALRLLSELKVEPAR